MTHRREISATPSRISRAAVALFSRQGYHGTTTREIARLADVSEVTLYRHFERKEDIFLAALHVSFGPVKPRLSLVNRGFEDPSPEIMLAQILSLLVDIATLSPELPKLIAIAFVELHGKAEDVCFEHLTPLFTAIARFLTANMATGKFRKISPEIATIAMTLTAIARPELSILIGRGTLSPLGGRESLSEYSKFWMTVLAPSPQESARDAERAGLTAVADDESPCM